MIDRVRLRRRLIIMTVVYGAVLAVAWFPAIFSVMLAARGTSLAVYVAVYSLMSFPFALAFSMIVPWLFYLGRMHRTANALLYLPIVNMIGILLYVIVPEVFA